MSEDRIAMVIARVFSVLLGCSTGFSAIAQPLPIDRIRLPPGFEISIFADNVPNARSMALGAKDVLFVGTRSGGHV